MIKGILGRKLGMTQVFRQSGEVVPVTVIQAGPCVVTQIRTRDRDGYEAVQIGYEELPARKVNKPESGHLRAAGKLLRVLREIDAENVTDHKVGETFDVSIFAPGQKVDVVGTSKGRGFTGVVKRHGFHGGPATHGQSDRERTPGAIGAESSPGRVWKGQKMAGRSGNARITTQNLEIVQVIPEHNIILVRGAVAGPNGGLVQVSSAVKSPAKGA